jgi:hypothetical protein
MIIDCDRCLARGAGACGAACLNCAATALLGPGPAGTGPDPDQDLDPATLRALTVLANAGMIAPLRYAPRLARAS